MSPEPSWPGSSCGPVMVAKLRSAIAVSQRRPGRRPACVQAARPAGGTMDPGAPGDPSAPCPAFGHLLEPPQVPLHVLLRVLQDAGGQLAEPAARGPELEVDL